MTIHTPPPASQTPLSDLARTRLEEAAGRVAAGTLIPYLGPETLGAPPVPATPEALALALHKRVPVGSRIRGNVWATAQFIESRRHRKTLTALMAEIFATPVAPAPLHLALAGLGLPLVVDTWYDGAMRSALVAAGRVDFAEIQGVTRSLAFRDIWTKGYSPGGLELPEAAAGTAHTILYKPHGAITPAKNFLVSDADYVEVLTEIDIQTPIPEAVKARREGRGFLFLGCRFHDQMLRTFARQIVKRSGGGHVAIAEASRLTKNERKFFEEIGAEVIDAATADAAVAIAAAVGRAQ